MRGIEGSHELSAIPPGGGSGMKFRKPFKPKTRKITPARYRAIAGSGSHDGFSLSVGH
jgi:hypothetical protein